MRQPAVANQFYSGNPKVLKEHLKQFIPFVHEKKQVISIIVPHAGYMYSGAVAGEVYSRVVIPEDVIILGVNHTGMGLNPSIYQNGDWIMPMGNVAINNELAAAILKETNLVYPDTQAHLYEHSLEVQAPFLQYLQENLKIVPINMSYLSYQTCQDIGSAIARAIKSYNKPVLIVSSTDMNHFLSQEQTKKLDSLAIDNMINLDPEGLYKTVLKNKISMCGVINTAITLIASINLGAKQCELVRYNTSGDVSGDYFRVVGYAGLIVD